MALCFLEKRKQDDPNYVWKEAMLNKHGLHPEWLSSFERSYAASKKICRVGGILDASSHSDRMFARHVISLFGRLNVRFWLCWGDVKDMSWRGNIDWGETPTEFEQLMPSDADIAALQETREARSDKSLGHSLAGLGETTGEDDDAEESSEVEPNSGQLPGETWKEFFRRRDQRRQGLYESEKAQQIRLAREKAAEGKSCPGRRGPTVWYWVKRSGVRVRTLLTRAVHEDYWRLYGPTEMRFDGFSNSWDLCTEFGGDEEDHMAVDDDWDESVYDEEMGMVDLPPPGGFDAHLLEERGSQINDDGINDGEREKGELEEGELEEGELGDVLGSSATGLGWLLNWEIGTDFKVENMKVKLIDIARERYGFVRRLDGGVEAPGGKEWKKTRELLGNGRWLSDERNVGFGDETDPKWYGMLHKHMTFLSNTEPSDYKTIPSLDLADNKNAIWNLAWWPFSVEKVALNTGETGYLIDGSSKGFGEDDNLRLLVWDPVSVVHAARTNMGETVPQIAQQMLEYGIRFHILRKGRRPTEGEMVDVSCNQHRDHNKCVLGHRRLGYRPDEHDWRAYEAERDRLLRTWKGRPAAMFGGLIGRIAREVVPDSDVVHGPDPDLVYKRGSCFLDTREGGLWGEELSTEDIDLVCGVYMLENPNGLTDDRKHMSWWRPGSFNAGGLNLDYWSMDCEKWLHFHLRTSKCEVATRTATEWRSYISMRQSNRRKVKQNALIAARFLDDIFA
ncbi:hypothetical protein AAF712_008559 [Marasmius tenuissimus]|uniref:Uncharacterized protein n=1 Tax=Marasmius tenuissimus TaxID=585030 RepID=A0ABR2ZTP8_9AGAR